MLNKKKNNIIIKGARQHNLNNINVEIPRNSLTVITGLSGSGKSTIANGVKVKLQEYVHFQPLTRL